MARLTLTVLGGFQARLDCEPVPVLPTRKTQALFAYLALSPGRSHSRDKLAGLLWGDVSESRARGGLRQALSRLRKAVAIEPPALILDGHTVSMNPDVVDVDAVEFERLASRDTPEALEQASALYRGDLLEGLALREPAFEEWLLGERDRLRERALDVLDRLLRHHGTGGRPEAALQAALRLAALDPLRESVHRALMRLYAQLGRRSAALRQYQICVSTLQRELGVEPEVATRQLYREVLRQRAAPRADRGETPSVPVVPRLADDAGLSREVSLIGREPETVRLREALDEAWASRGRALPVIGEAGVGKSRLVAELVAEASARGGQVLVGRCYEAEQILPFGPWVEMLRTARLDSADPALERLSRSTWAELARLLPETREAGHEPPAGPADYRLLFESVVQVFRALAVHRPLTLVIEDLHWADEISLRLLAFVARRLATSAIMLVGTARDEDLAAAPLLRRTLADLDAMPLAPLSKAETLRLVRALSRSAGDEATLTDLGERIWSASEGNPFVVVETVRALSAASRPEDISRMTVPRRVRELIIRHLEGSSRRGRELATLAAVIGREFEFALLGRASGLDDADTAEAVEELVRRRILRHFGERLDFVHDRIREVVYEESGPDRQRALHARVTGAIENVYNETLDDHVERLAHHAVRGGLHDTAVVALRRAGSKAFSNSAHADALHDFTQALQLLVHIRRVEDRDREELALRLALGPTLQVARGHAAPGVEENYRRARDLAARAGTAVQRFQSLWGLWLAASYRADSDKALQLGRELLTLAEESRDPALLLEGHHALWPVLVWRGRLAEALGHAEHGRSLYDPAEHRSHAFVYGGHDPGMCSRKYASWAFWLLGYPARALDESKASLELTEWLGHPPSVVLARVWACVFHDLRRELPAVREHARSLITVAKDTPQWLAAGMIIDGWVQAESGEPKAAVARIREGLRVYASTGAALFAPYFRSLLARACARNGETEAGLEAIGEALRQARATGELVWEPELLRLEGEMRLGLRPADAAGARDCFHRAIEIARTEGARSWELRATLSLARVLAADDQRAEGHRILRGVYDWFTEGFDTPDLTDARTLLDELA
jgi:DNA-binding SARP family transcriptional activator/predicted ATPase